MSDPKKMTVRLRGEYHTGKGDPKKAGEQISLDSAEAKRLIDNGMAVDPATPDAATVGSDDARLTDLRNEMAMLRTELETLQTAKAADEKTITDLRGDLAKATAEVSKLKAT